MQTPTRASETKLRVRPINRAFAVVALLLFCRRA
jgi:hypothetical protein